MQRYQICFHPSWYHENAGVDFSQAFWDDPQVRMQADQVMRHALYEHFGAYGIGEENPQPRPLVGSDLLACGYLFSEMLGCEIRYAPHDSPQVLCAQLDDDACFALQKPVFERNEAWQRLQRQLDALHLQFGHVESYINLMGVQNMAMDLRGQDLFVDYYDEESPAQHLLQVCCDTLQEAGTRLRAYTPYISAGVTNIVTAVCPEVFLTSNCSVEMVSQAVYEEHLLPYDTQLAKSLEPFGIHHCGATMEHVVHGYAKVPNLRFVEVGAGSDLAAVWDALPADVLINARVSPTRLANISADALRRELEEMARIIPGDRLSVSCVGIDAKTSDSQICLFLEEARRLLGA